ncbi:hypothetical protein EVAR_102373_1 [Eumeta japonica]|uniref:MADF domain-containing protein n=1 Tax=Eumeta variegata TaxID=151549 RepID=A0A4C2A5B9_EUMVA|nr:hypothetical protein EVAR_102373_1 [Eumeta japonica]
MLENYKDTNLRTAAWREVCVILREDFQEMEKKERQGYEQDNPAGGAKQLKAEAFCNRSKNGNFYWSPDEKSAEYAEWRS